MFQVDLPVLLIGFNRPDMIRQSLDNLREQHVQNLYISIDGPRPENDDDVRKVEEVRTLVKGIDFCPKLHLMLREQNVGCEINVSDGINWVLEKEDFVIVLEDDVIAHESFFRFMQEMLLRYANDSRVAMVSGSNYTPIEFPNNEDYCFCQCGHTGGGWATWKRVWKDFDLNEVINSEYLKTDFLRSVSVNHAMAKRRKRCYRKMQRDGAGRSTWDTMFSYFRVTRRMLSVVPKSHLTSNIGLYGLHYSGMGKGLMMKIDEDFRVRNHPEYVKWNREYDQYHYEHYLKESFIHKVIRHVKRIVG